MYFKNFFYDDECGKNIQAGRMQKYVHNKNRGILFTTGDNDSDNPNLKPLNRWRSHAHLLFGNWINQIYQEVPFEIEKIGKI